MLDPLLQCAARLNSQCVRVFDENSHRILSYTYVASRHTLSIYAVGADRYVLTLPPRHVVVC